jgi:hypothetical protein
MGSTIYKTYCSISLLLPLHKCRRKSFTTLTPGGRQERFEVTAEHQEPGEESFAGSKMIYKV